MLRWFGHMERTVEYCMARTVLMAEVTRGLVRGRPRLGWMDGVKMALGSRGTTVEATRKCAKDRKARSALVPCGEFLLASCVLSDPFRDLVAYHLERCGMPLHGAVGENFLKGRNY